MLLKNQIASGNCYEAAFQLLHQIEGEQVVLCHGIATQSRSPHNRIGHAWLEELHGKAWFVRDALFPLSLVPREIYYKVGKILSAEVVRYSRLRANLLVNEKKHFGPFNRRIAAATHC
jgi:hypothetical protein